MTIPVQRRVVAVSQLVVHRSVRALDAADGYSNPPRTTVEARLRKAMSGRSKLRWRADLSELIVAAEGGDHSVLEFRYHRDVERAHGLPEPARQVPFSGPVGRRGRRDRVYQELGVVVELDGRLAMQGSVSGGTRPRPCSPGCPVQPGPRASAER